jgi:hypothetical protein
VELLPGYPATPLAAFPGTDSLEVDLDNVLHLNDDASSCPPPEPLSPDELAANMAAAADIEMQGMTQ